MPRFFNIISIAARNIQRIQNCHLTALKKLQQSSAKNVPTANLFKGYGKNCNAFGRAYFPEDGFWIYCIRMKYATRYSVRCNMEVSCLNINHTLCVCRNIHVSADEMDGARMATLCSLVQNRIIQISPHVRVVLLLQLTRGFTLELYYSKREIKRGTHVPH